MSEGSRGITGDLRWEIVRAVRPEDVTRGDYERALAVIERERARGAADQEITRRVADEVPIFRRLEALADKSSWIAGGVVTGLAAAASIYGGYRTRASDEADQQEWATPQPPVDIEVQPHPAADEETARAVERYISAGPAPA